MMFPWRKQTLLLNRQTVQTLEKTFTLPESLPFVFFLVPSPPSLFLLASLV